MHGTARMIAASAALATMLLGGSAALAGATTGTTRIYVTEQADTLVDIAVDAGLGFLELKTANPGVDVWVPGEARGCFFPAGIFCPTRRRKASSSIWPTCAFTCSEPEAS